VKLKEVSNQEEAKEVEVGAEVGVEVGAEVGAEVAVGVDHQVEAAAGVEVAVVVLIGHHHVAAVGKEVRVRQKVSKARRMRRKSLVQLVQMRIKYLWNFSTCQITTDLWCSSSWRISPTCILRLSHIVWLQTV
jgi:hypothetical protein